MASSSRTSSRNPSRSVSSASLPTSRRSTLTASAELSPAAQEKAAEISTACQNRDVDALVRLATSTLGLVSDTLRRAAWPILLGCAPDVDNKQEEQVPWRDLPAHREEGQVALDVHRAFVYYPKNSSDKQLSQLKDDLSSTITATLRRHPTLCYFQGYHDIVQVLMLVLGAPAAPAAVTRLSLLRIRDFMLSSLDPAMAHLSLLNPILAAADPALHTHLPKSQPNFAVAGTITMFAHNIQDYGDIARLFDFFLARHTVMPIYFFAAVVLSRRDEVLEIDREDEDIMHAVLGKLPQPFDVEFHIARSVELYERLPPESLASWTWWKISSASVLKTSSTPRALASLTLQDAETWMLQQEKEVRRQQLLKRVVGYSRAAQKKTCRTLWVYRRQGAFGLAILVGVYALWLGRPFGPRVSSLGPLSELLKKAVSIVRP